MSACTDVEEEALAWLRADASERRAAAARARQVAPPEVRYRRQQAARAAGGIARGEANPRARLTDDQVRAIRSRRAAGEISSELAAEFGITRRMVNLIASRQRWAHVAD